MSNMGPLAPDVSRTQRIQVAKVATWEAQLQPMPIPVDFIREWTFSMGIDMIDPTGSINLVSMFPSSKTGNL